MKRTVCGVVLTCLVLLVSAGVLVRCAPLIHADPLTDVLVGYFFGVHDALPDVFTPREIAHLTDIRTLVTRSLYVMCGLAIAFVVCVFTHCVHMRTIRTVAGCVAVFPVLVALFFPLMFPAFHYLVFPAGSWLFPPGTTLVETYPRSFFMLMFLLYALLNSLVALAFYVTTLCLPQRGVTHK